MKKRGLLLICTLLLLMVAAVFCACGGGGGSSSSGGSKDNTKKEKWITTTDQTKSAVCSKFLSSFTTIAKDLSVDELNKGNRTVGLSSLIKVKLNDNDFYLAVKIKYNYKDPDNTMASLELSDKEIKENEYDPDDLLFGMYLCPRADRDTYPGQQMLYVAVGSTKFSIDIETAAWNRFFPFHYKETVSSGSLTDDPGWVLASILRLKNENFTQRKREVGTVTEYNFVLDVDVTRTLQQVVQFVDSDLGKKFIDNPQEIYDALDEIFTGVFGVTAKDVNDGNLADSSLKIDFTTSLANKISALEATLKVDDSKNTGTIFGGEDMEIGISLKRFDIKNFNDVPFPFINDANKQERNNYLYFLDKGFRLQVNQSRLLKETHEDYEMTITAKIFQGERKENFAFMTYKDASGLAVMGAVYQDVGYLFKRVDGEMVCTLSVPLDISTIAEMVVDNAFEKLVVNEEGDPVLDKEGNVQYEKAASLNVLSAVGYLLSALRINPDDVRFSIDHDLFTSVWYNFFAAIDYLNDRFDEDLYELDEVKEFMDFVIDSRFVVYFPYDKPFLTLVGNDDADLQAAIRLVTETEPLLRLEEKESLRPEPGESENTQGDESGQSEE